MTPNIKQHISVVGAGAWGTALAIHLARCGHAVTLWGKDDAEMQAMQAARCHKQGLPDVVFPDNLTVAKGWESIDQLAPIVLLAVPSHVFKLVLRGIQPKFSKATQLIWATKGLDAEHNQLLETVVVDICGAQQSRAVLSGPSFAKEVARDLPTAVVIASPEQSLASSLAAVFNSARFRVYTSTDMIGVQLGGALKNVIAIAVGISDGLGFGANAKSALITRGLAELIRLGAALGAKPDTFMGLTGIGDLVLTCTDDQSRNRRMGLALGQGELQETAQHAIGQVVEGAHTADIMLALAKQYQIELPITAVVHQVLTKQLSPQAAVEVLLSRDQKTE